MTIRTKRVFETPTRRDGRRILVDRLWPRGLTKRDAGIDFWARAVAPSDALRRWYRHNPAKWPEFTRRYRAELEANPDGVTELLGQLGPGTVTLLYASRETRLNNATALKAFLEAGAGRGSTTKRR